MKNLLVYICRTGYCMLSAMVFLLCIVSVHSTSGQSNLDSLRLLYENAGTDSLKYETVRKYEQATRKVDRVAALPLMKQRVKWAQVNGNDDWLMKSYSTLGNNYLYLSKVDSAELYLKRSVDLAVLESNQRFLNLGLNSLAAIYEQQNEIESAVEIFHQVLMAADSIKDYKTQIATYNNLANLLIGQFDYNRALNYLEKIEPIYESIKDEDVALKDACKSYLSGAFLNIGNCYNQQKDYEIAKGFYGKAQEYLDFVPDEYSKTYFRSYIDYHFSDLELRACKMEGDCLDSIDKVLEKSELAVAGFRKIDYAIGVASSLIVLAESNILVGNLNNAEEALDESLDLANQLESIDIRSKALKAKSDLSVSINEYQSAYELLENSYTLKDSVRNAERDLNWQNLEKKFETAQKENEILNLKLENEQKTRRQNRQTFAFIISILSLLAGGYFIYSRYKLKKERELAQFERDINTAMSRFVPMSFIRAIGREDILDVELGDKVEKEVTVVFTDIRGFTSISEGLTPDENFDFVKEYAALMGPIIESNNGFINQYLGDGIMAIFDQTPSNALRACLSMQAQIAEFNLERIHNDLPPIKVGMGMHTGPLILGIIGDQIRRDATIISDTVNSAARIENTTKMYSKDILLSHSSYELLSNQEKSGCSLIGDVEVKGKLEPIKVYSYDI